MKSGYTYTKNNVKVSRQEFIDVLGYDTVELMETVAEKDGAEQVFDTAKNKEYADCYTIKLLHN